MHRYNICQVSLEERAAAAKAAPASSVKHVTYEQLFQAMNAAAVTPFNVMRRASNDGDHRPRSSRLSPKGPVVASTRSVPRPAAVTTPSNTHVTPPPNAKVFVPYAKVTPPTPPNHAATTQPTIVATRPETTTVVANRMIGSALNINFAKKDDATLKKSLPAPAISVAKKVHKVHPVHIDHEIKAASKKSGLVDDTGNAKDGKKVVMAIGLGGSIWATPEARAKAVMRPIDEFLSEHDRMACEQARIINEKMSLKFDRVAVYADEEKPAVVAEKKVFVAPTKEAIYAAMRAAVF